MDPFPSFNTLFKDFHTLIPRETGVPCFSNGALFCQSTADVIDKKSHYDIIIPCPGFLPSDIKVTPQGNKLEVKGERMIRRQNCQAFYSSMEQTSSKFVKYVDLPPDTNPKGIVLKSSGDNIIIQVGKKLKKTWSLRS